ncbi:hypothetical protein SmJEL517_g01558 [Synchytrium microbalum]|uniref:Uncharacterized protein n=1 Tax=Synchytrium microbalum TaxID=1806994 RepID=A0A507CFS7_9FUNG|nr:uncharacterized protein SmJEL517_g01558 [Synchytrium microbalum]TPX36363.1 hypothetical protein SmJEL517_g01558 [Synchytrium microbalum]
MTIPNRYAFPPSAISKDPYALGTQGLTGRGFSANLPRPGTYPKDKPNSPTNNGAFLPTRKARRIPKAMEVPGDIWEKIFLYVAEEEGSLGSMQGVVLVSRWWERVVKEPKFRAGYLLKKSCVHLAFYDAFKKNPALLSMEVADAMLRLGCHLPKYFVEYVYRIHETTRNMNPPHPAYPLRLSEETVQFLVAQAYKTYGDSVDTNLENPSGQESSDAALFDDCFGYAAPDDTQIKQLVDSHHFTPALASPTSVDEWEVHWSNMLKLCKVNPSMGMFLAGHSGKGRAFANDAMLNVALRDPKTTTEWFQELLSLGFELTPSNIEDLMASTRYPIQDIPYAVEMLRHFSSHEAELTLIAEGALSRLLEGASPMALRTADYIITEFSVPEDGVMRALLLDPKTVRCRKSQPELVFMTKLGKATNGFRDGLWQLILGRYGADNMMTSACLQDLVVGGNSNLTIPAPVFRNSSSSNSDTASIHSTSTNADTTAEDDDGTARDSVATLLESGVSIDPAMFGAVARAVLVTRKCRPRYLDFLVRVEQTLAGASLSNLPPAPPSMLDSTMNSDTTRTRLARVRWTAALRRYVLDDAAWKAAAQMPLKHHHNNSDSGSGPTVGGTLRGYADQALQMLELPSYTRQMAEVRRFFREVEALFDELPEAPGRILPNSNIWEGPFTRWRSEREWIASHGVYHHSNNSNSSGGFGLSSDNAAAVNSLLNGFGPTPPGSPQQSNRSSVLIGIRETFGSVSASVKSLTEQSATAITEIVRDPSRRNTIMLSSVFSSKST